MTGLQPETPDASTSERSESGRTARLRVAEAARVAVRQAIEPGVADGIAAALRESSLEAGTEVRDMAFGMARPLLAEACERPAGHGGTVEAGGRTYRKADATTGLSLV